MKQTLRVIFEVDSIGPLDSWITISNHLNQNKLLSPEYVFDGESVDLKKLDKALRKSSCATYRIEDDTFVIDHGVVRNNSYCYVDVQCKKSVTLDWEILVIQLHNEGDLISAWVEDADYTFWQNAQDVLQYKAAGRSIEGLPMKSNGLPAPLEQKVIDTSRNPGRWLHRTGYVEAVSSHMWFADTFWKLTGADPKELPGLEQLDVGISRLNVQDDCFSHASGEEALRQEELRSALYPGSEK